MSKTGKIIGIDLGTTNSCVAIMEGSSARVLENSEGARTTPSVVAFVGGASKAPNLVGTPAVRQATTNAENTFYEVKRLIGRRFDEKTVKDFASHVPFKVVAAANGDASVQTKDGRTFVPSQISAEVLIKMKTAAETYLGESVTRAVVTVPAYFNDAQRQATKDAGRIAGLEVERIINEPTAAALAYGLDKKSGTVFVFDLGGGTFDVSILDINDGVFEVKATDGNTTLGGGDFDGLLVKFLADKFHAENGIDLRKDMLARYRLKEAAERAKIELSSALETQVSLPFITADASGPKHLTATVSRAKFESLTEHLVEDAIKLCKKVLEAADLKTGDIDHIIMVGGMTRMPKIVSAVEKMFGKECYKGVNPDEVVAIGAAIQGGILGGDVKDLLLLDVAPLSLGIETLGGVFTKIIERNTTIPTRKSQVFSTAADNQPAVSIQVYQGERKMAADNKSLGNFELTGIPNAPRGVPQIEVTFDIDANGIVHVSAKDKNTGREQKISIRNSGGLSESDIERMVQEAENNREADEQRLQKIEVTNRASSLLSQVVSGLDKHAKELADSDRDTIETNKKALEDALQNDDVEAIEQAEQTLMESAKPLFELVDKAAASSQDTAPKDIDADNAE